MAAWSRISVWIVGQVLWDLRGQQRNCYDDIRHKSQCYLQDKYVRDTPKCSLRRFDIPEFRLLRSHVGVWCPIDADLRASHCSEIVDSPPTGC
jgi:hypothetical protein